MTDEDIMLAFSFPEGVDGFEHNDDTRSSSMSALSPFDESHDPERERIAERLRSGTLGEEEDRAFGALLGLAIGDALGAPLEFSPVQYGSAELAGFDAGLWNKGGYNHFGRKQVSGQTTPAWRFAWPTRC